MLSVRASRAAQKKAVQARAAGEIIVKISEWDKLEKMARRRCVFRPDRLELDGLHLRTKGRYRRLDFKDTLFA